MFNINQFFFKNIYPKTSVETNKHTVFNDDRKWNQVWNQQSRAVPPSLSSSVIIIVIVFIIVIVIAAVIVVNTKIYEQSFLESDISHNKTKANIYNRKLQCCEVICLPQERVCTPLHKLPSLPFFSFLINFSKQKSFSFSINFYF